MNEYMKSYIDNACAYLRTFQTSLKMAALQDDKAIDKQEQKVLDKANKLTEKYIGELKKLID